MKTWAVVLLIFLCATGSVQAMEGVPPLVTIVKNISIDESMAMGLVLA